MRIRGDYDRLNYQSPIILYDNHRYIGQYYYQADCDKAVRKIIHDKGIPRYFTVKGVELNPGVSFSLL